MTSKKIVYLVQGSRKNVKQFGHLQSDLADLITLTYDFDLEAPDVVGLSNIFLPQSTWAEGRNKLLEASKSLHNDWLYYVFLDDDVIFESGGVEKFQAALMYHKPLVGMPLCDAIKSSGRYSIIHKVQRPVALDQLCQAYHRDVVSEGLVVPFDTKFDPQSWWYSCEINQFLILKCYPTRILQFNYIKIVNGNHCWDKDLNSHAVENSIYAGGITETVMDEVRKYIVSKFGEQPHGESALFPSPDQKQKPKIVRKLEFFFKMLRPQTY